MSRPTVQSETSSPDPQPGPKARFRLGRWTVVQDTGELLSDGERRQLSPRDLEVLVYLTDHRGRVVSGKEVVDAVWEGAFVSEKVVRNAVGRLREALGDDAASPTYIETFRGRGYRLISAVHLGVVAQREDSVADPPAVEAAVAAPRPASRSTSAKRPRSPRAQPDPALRLLALVALCWIVLISVLAVAQAARQDQAHLAPEERQWVVVGQFRNLTGNSEIDHALNLAFRILFEQSRSVSVVPVEDVRATLDRIGRDRDAALDRELGREVSRREDARALILGSVVEIGEEYAVNAEVVDPASGRTVFSHQVLVSDFRHLLSALDGLGAEVRSHLHDALLEIEAPRLRLDKIATPDLAALESFALAREAAALSQWEEAKTLLLRAVDIDPGFARAWIRLGAIEFLSHPESGRASDYLRRAVAREDRLDEQTRLLAEGWLATSRYDVQEMLQAWTALSVSYRDEIHGHYNLGMTYKYHLHDFARAVAAFERASTFGRSHALRSRAIEQLVASRLASGEVAQARSEWDRYSEMEEAFDVGKWFLRSQVEAGRGADDALRAIEERIGTSYAPRYAIARVFILLDQRRLPAVSAEVRRLARMANARGDLRYSIWADLIEAELRVRFRDSPPGEAWQALRRTIRGRLRDVRWVPTDASLLAVLGKGLARAGDLEAAGQTQAILESMACDYDHPVLRSLVGLVAGERLTALGRAGEAIETLRAALGELESLQGRESLAHALVASGEQLAARPHYAWVVQRQGRVSQECHLDQACKGRAFNLLVWIEASRSLRRAPWEVRGARQDPV